MILELPPLTDSDRALINRLYDHELRLRDRGLHLSWNRGVDFGHKSVGFLKISVDDGTRETGVDRYASHLSLEHSEDLDVLDHVVQSAVRVLTQRER